MRRVRGEGGADERARSTERAPLAIEPPPTRCCHSGRSPKTWPARSGEGPLLAWADVRAYDTRGPGQRSGVLVVSNAQAMRDHGAQLACLVWYAVGDRRWNSQGGDQ